MFLSKMILRMRNQKTSFGCYHGLKRSCSTAWLVFCYLAGDKLNKTFAKCKFRFLKNRLNLLIVWKIYYKKKYCNLYVVGGGDIYDKLFKGDSSANSAGL